MACPSVLPSMKTTKRHGFGERPNLCKTCPAQHTPGHSVVRMHKRPHLRYFQFLVSPGRAPTCQLGRIALAPNRRMERVAQLHAPARIEQVPIQAAPSHELAVALVTAARLGVVTLSGAGRRGAWRRRVLFRVGHRPAPASLPIGSSPTVLRPSILRQSHWYQSGTGRMRLRHLRDVVAIAERGGLRAASRQAMFCRAQRSAAGWSCKPYAPGPPASSHVRGAAFSAGAPWPLLHPGRGSPARPAGSGPARGPSCPRPRARGCGSGKRSRRPARRGRSRRGW